jgi:hypothetical protein
VGKPWIEGEGAKKEAGPFYPFSEVVGKGNTAEREVIEESMRNRIALIDWS